MLADDSAASIAAGGLVPRRETRIVMAKEVLRISDKKVIVDYDFRNDTDQDVTTEVAFPIPPYVNESIDGPSIDESSFKSFRLWVNNKPVSYDSEAKATLKGKDVTSVLKTNQIDIPTFGHFVDTVDSKGTEVIGFPDFSRLSKSAQDQLVKAGLFDVAPDPWAKWTVNLQYHWRQTFPANSTVHIRHEYVPVVGFNSISLGAIKLAFQPTYQTKRPVSDFSGVFTSFCPDQPFLRGIDGPAVANDPNGDDYDTAAGLSFVDFILTTANTWQRPIADFTLVVERPVSEQGGKTLVSFCSPANRHVEKLDTDHFQVHLTNFVPASELHIGFFEIAPMSVPDYTTAMKSVPVSHPWVSGTFVGLIAGGILLSLGAIFIRHRKRSPAKANQN
jgi:hypothetical protein